MAQPKSQRVFPQGELQDIDPTGESMNTLTNGRRPRPRQSLMESIPFLSLGWARNLRIGMISGHIVALLVAVSRTWSSFAVSD
jgi:hypothetical protein